ncbi:MAG: hypothetical protein ACTSYG_08430 [Candidatus Heimdallarchaeota archaeon]
MPYGGTTPEQDRKIERCVAAQMEDPKMKAKYKDPKVRKSHAIAICKASVMKKEDTSVKVLENVPLQFSTPIKEAVQESSSKNRIKIRGTMIKAATSRNNRTYTMEELEKAKFTGDTISVNHTDSVTDNVGHYEPILTDDGYDFVGEIVNTPYHPGIVEMIQNGLIKFVSIEAIAGQMVQEGNNVLVKDLDFTGLGLVKTPGFESATMAIAEALENNVDEIGEAKLTYQQRKNLPSSSFAYTTTVTGKSGKKIVKKQFPIHDAAHVRNALARIAQGKWGVVPPEARKAVLRKIINKAKRLGIEVNKNLLKKAGLSSESLEVEVENMTEEEKTEPQEETKEEEKTEEEPKKEEEKTEEEPKKEEPSEVEKKIEKLEKTVSELSETVKKLTEKKSKGIVTENAKPSLKIISKKGKGGVSFYSEDLEY